MSWNCMGFQNFNCQLSTELSLLTSMTQLNVQKISPSFETLSHHKIGFVYVANYQSYTHFL